MRTAAQLLFHRYTPALSYNTVLRKSFIDCFGLSCQYTIKTCTKFLNQVQELLEISPHLLFSYQANHPFVF